MILSALVDHYRRLQADAESGISPPGYSQEKISYAIVLDMDGRVVDVHDLRDTSGRRPAPLLLDVPRPEKRTVDVKSNFLWDKTSYVLGVSASSKRAEQEHEEFKTRHRGALSTVDDPGLRALLSFLDSWSPAQFSCDPSFSAHGESMLDANVVFRIDGDPHYLHQRPEARRVWSDQAQNREGTSRATCLVTGERSVLARLHPAIKGVSGAQSTGASIVSFNLDAFTSYGKSQGENAPVSEWAAFAYATALNHLLRRNASNRQSIQIGDTTVVFWANASEIAQAQAAEDLIADFLAGTPDDAISMADGRATQRLHMAMEKVRQGRPLRDLDGMLDDEARIFVLGLAPNVSRLSIRFWETQTLAVFARRLADHYADLELDPRAWKRPPTPQYLALQIAPIRGEKGRPKPEDVPPLLAGELTRAILAGTRYPRSLLAAVVMRFRADGQIRPLRVALCKAILAREARLRRKQGLSSTTKGEPPVSLDTGNTEPGYLLGRLFATLESIQYHALGKLNSTIRDRYYGAASATPASIFPVLMRNAQNHLGKLRRDKAGLAVNLEKEVGQIVDALPSQFPRTLPLEEQGRFAIGYYHQTQARFDRIDDRTANSENDSGGEAP